LNSHFCLHNSWIEHALAALHIELERKVWETQAEEGPERVALFFLPIIAQIWPESQVSNWVS
jgi:hypothetical protein